MNPKPFTPGAALKTLFSLFRCNMDPWTTTINSVGIQLETMTYLATFYKYNTYRVEEWESGVEVSLFPFLPNRLTGPADIRHEAYEAD